MFSILCFGDSVVYGRGEIPSNGWVGRLKIDFEDELIHKGIYNLGIPGETTHSLKKRIREESLPRIWRRKSSDRYIAIIGVGGNDAKEIITKENNMVKPDEFYNNLISCIDNIKDLFDNIVLINIGHIDEDKTQPFDKNVYFSNKYLREYSKIIEKISIEKNTYLCDVSDFCNNKQDQKEFLADGIHPNSIGYDELYKKIKLFLDKENLLDN